MENNHRIRISSRYALHVCIEREGGRKLCNVHYNVLYILIYACVVYGAVQNVCPLFTLLHILDSVHQCCSTPPSPLGLQSPHWVPSLPIGSLPSPLGPHPPHWVPALPIGSSPSPLGPHPPHWVLTLPIESSPSPLGPHPPLNLSIGSRSTSDPHHYQKEQEGAFIASPDPFRTFPGHSEHQRSTSPPPWFIAEPHVPPAPKDYQVCLFVCVCVCVCVCVYVVCV